MRLLGRGWRVAYAVMVVVLGLSLAGAASAQPAGKGKPGGATCPIDSAQDVQVVLDPGHGGDDPGAVANGIVEAELNLDIARRVASQLGYATALTRQGDTTLGNSERGDIANVCGALVYVSIHFNASSIATDNYTQTFWGKKRKDLDFAAWMSAAVDNTYGLRSNGAGQFANGALLSATMPATLIESAFITNTNEAALLNDPESGRRDQIAAAIATGIADWLASQGY